MAGPLTFDLPTESFPKGWGKSARETKSNYLMDETNKTLSAAQDEAFSLRDTENARGSSMEAMLRDAMKAADQPTMTQADIDRGFGRAVDTGGQAFKGGMGNLRSMIGDSGWTGGGWAAGIAADLEGQYLGSLVTARSSLFDKKATSDALDRLNSYGRTFDFATKVVDRAPAMEGSDFLNMLAGIRLTQGTQQGNLNAAKDASNAAKDAGAMAAGGDIIKGAFAAFA